MDPSHVDPSVSGSVDGSESASLSGKVPTISNAAMLASIEAAFESCVGVLRSIDAKPTTKSFHYVVRMPLEDASPSKVIDDPTCGGPPGVAPGAGAGLRRSLREVSPKTTKLAMVAVPVFKVEEITTLMDSKEILRKVAFNLHLEPIDDFFNDKLQYTCKTFDDVRRLATLLWPIAKKFSLFGESGNVNHLLATFQANYERIRVGLDKALAKIQDAPSKRARIQSGLDVANASLSSAATLDAAFYKVSVATGPPDCPNCPSYARAGHSQCNSCYKAFT